MVALRSADNPSTPLAVLNALKSVLVPNTRLAQMSASGTGLEQVFINNLPVMAVSAFPAVTLSYGKQTHKRTSRSTWSGVFPCLLTYYDRWDTRPATLDSVYATLSADVLRIYANIESNDRLTVGGVSYTQTLSLRLSAYYGEIDLHSVPGLSLLHRTITVQCVTPPYDA